MRHVDIKTKIPELIPQIPDWEAFVRLGNLTKLRQNDQGEFHHANYESGLLLYAIIRHYKPAQILEIGTGRGYGAFCMAMALRDNGTQGKIITLDVKSYTDKQTWPFDDGSGPRIESFSLQEVWEGYLDAELRAMIELRQGFSSHAMQQLLQENTFHPQFIYIDGNHTYPVSRHDLFASLLLADSSSFRILLDDYTPHSHIYGVRRLVDSRLAPVFELEAIHNDRRWYGEANQDRPVSDSHYAQVLLDSQRAKQNWQMALPRAELERTVKQHRQWGWYSAKWEDTRISWYNRLGWKV